MASSTTLLLCSLVAALLFQCSYGTRKLTALVEQPLLPMTYHKGALLTGPVTVSLIWYGNFTASQRAVISDFVSSLSASPPKGGDQIPEPSVAAWWKTTDKYYQQEKARIPTLTLGDQILDEKCSLGKSLKNGDLLRLASGGRRSNAVNVVLTASDVAVEGFCMSRCGTHAASPPSKSGRFAYIWVGDSAAQCAGQCAWPFHQPEFGPQAQPLVAPNGDVGVDGMVINLASMMAGAVTNPFGDGFYQGDQGAPLEAATACPGVYAKGAYPGYAGDLLVDPTTGASYNANGARGRKFLVPALVDPTTSACSTLV